MPLYSQKDVFMHKTMVTLNPQKKKTLKAKEHDWGLLEVP